MTEPKFCPWCGYDLSELQAEIKFCPECGKELTVKSEQGSASAADQPDTPEPKAAAKAEKKKTESTAKSTAKTPHKKSAADQAALDAAINARLDNGYDGYYDDVLPVDYGAKTAGLNKAAMKQIALCCGVGAVIIIVMVGIMLL